MQRRTTLIVVCLLALAWAVVSVDVEDEMRSTATRSHLHALHRARRTHAHAHAHTRAHRHHKTEVDAEDQAESEEDSVDDGTDTNPDNNPTPPPGAQLRKELPAAGLVPITSSGSSAGAAASQTTASAFAAPATNGASPSGNIQVEVQEPGSTGAGAPVQAESQANMWAIRNETGLFCAHLGPRMLTLRCKEHPDGNCCGTTGFCCPKEHFCAVDPQGNIVSKCVHETKQIIITPTIIIHTGSGTGAGAGAGATTGFNQPSTSASITAAGAGGSGGNTDGNDYGDSGEPYDEEADDDSLPDQGAVSIAPPRYAAHAKHRHRPRRDKIVLVMHNRNAINRGKHGKHHGHDDDEEADDEVKHPPSTHTGKRPKAPHASEDESTGDEAVDDDGQAQAAGGVRADKENSNSA